MNLIKQGLQKVGMVLSVAVLWVLDDIVIVLPDAAVWSITQGLLTICGHADRFESLKAFWSGKTTK